MKSFRDLVTEKRALILEQWFDRLLEDYPPESRAFFRENGSPYLNPIGYTLRKGMEGILDELLQEGEGGDARGVLEPVMKVRAVEDLPPSRGGNFILPLRDVVARLTGEKEGTPGGREWAGWNARIAGLALLSMTLYSECREKVRRLALQEREKWGGAIPTGGAGA